VKATLDKFAKSSVVEFSAYLIHSHLAETAFLALEEVYSDNLPKAQRSEVEQAAKKALKNLKKFSAVFVIGEPALNRYRANGSGSTTTLKKPIPIGPRRQPKPTPSRCPTKQGAPNFYWANAYLPITQIGKNTSIRPSRSSNHPATRNGPRALNTGR